MIVFKAEGAIGKLKNLRANSKLISRGLFCSILGRMATSGGTSRDNTAKAMVTDQISQAIQSTSNLLQLMQQSSSSQTQLMKLPKNLFAKTPTIKNTGQLLEQMARVISSLDAHMDSGLQSIPHLKTVIQLLENMETNQLSSLAQPHQPQEKKQLSKQK